MKCSILPYVSLKIGYFELGHDSDTTVTSYLGCWYLFWYVWKKETPSYTMVQIRCIWGSSSSQGVVTTLLVRQRLSMIGVKRVSFHVGSLQAMFSKVQTLYNRPVVQFNAWMQLYVSFVTPSTSNSCLHATACCITTDMFYCYQTCLICLRPFLK